MHNEIQILSKKLNYVDSKKAVNTLKKMSEEEKNIVLNDKNVINTILSIRDTSILRDIFRLVPDFFQEIMFNNEDVQNYLISPRPTLTKEKMLDSYNKMDISFREEELRKLEVFLKTIKSPKVREQIIENKFFQMIIPLCYETQLSRSFFDNLDTEKLFYNITSDDFIFSNTRAPRKRNVLNIFNKVSNHVLLVPSYSTILQGNEVQFISSKSYLIGEENQIIIDKETFNMLTPKMIDRLLEMENADRKFLEECLYENVVEIVNKEDYSVKDLVDTNGEKINHIRSIQLYYLTIASDLIKDNKERKKEYIDFLFKQTGDYSNVSEEVMETFKKTFFDRINSRNMSVNQMNMLLCYSPNVNKTIFFLKFNKTSRRMDYLDSITGEQLLKLNIKHINQLIKLLDDENEDEISLTYAKAIKLYLVFGYERSLRILRREYGNLNRHFFDNLLKLDTSSVRLEKEGSKYIPVISNDFINFMFSNEKENHFKKMLSDASSTFNKYWYYLYNNFSDIKERCHGTVTLKRVNTILDKFSPEKDISDVSYDNYKLQENDILNDVCLGNITTLSNEQVYKSLLDIYDKMKLRTESSIPYVKGKCENGYSYEMMKFNDPIAFTLGYKANCCIRVEGIAHKHLLHATLCRNGRILIIYDRDMNIAAFSPLKRNGEVLIANSIECAHKKGNQNAVKAFEEAIKDIVTVSSAEKEPIKLVCIGTEAYAKPQGKPFPRDIKTPTIYEKEDSIYQNTDIYHKFLDIIYKDSSINLNNIKYGDPKASYRDPRNKPVHLEFSYQNREDAERALKAINGIRYSLIKDDMDKLENFKCASYYDIKECVYSEDFFVAVLRDGKVVGGYLPYDERAEEEYSIAYKNLYDKTNKKMM